MEEVDQNNANATENGAKLKPLAYVFQNMLLIRNFFFVSLSHFVNCHFDFPSSIHVRSLVRQARVEETN